MSLTRNAGSTQDDRLQQALDALLRSSTGIRSCVLASADGFVVAEANLQDAAGEKLAAMSSSMVGLATAIARELSFGALETLVLDACDGKVVMLAIPAPDRDLVMLVSCGSSSTLGHVLYSARTASSSIIEAMS